MQKMNIVKKISIIINTDQNRSSKGGGYVKVYHLEKNNIDSIPPLLYDDKIISDDYTKANILMTILHLYPTLQMLTDK